MVEEYRPYTWSMNSMKRWMNCKDEEYGEYEKKKDKFVKSSI